MDEPIAPDNDDWGRQPDRRRMAVETKLGLFIVTILLGAFGFLVYRNVDLHEKRLMARVDRESVKPTEPGRAGDSLENTSKLVIDKIPQPQSKPSGGAFHDGHETSLQEKVKFNFEGPYLQEPVSFQTTPDDELTATDRGSRGDPDVHTEDAGFDSFDPSSADSRFEFGDPFTSPGNDPDESFERDSSDDTNLDGFTANAASTFPTQATSSDPGFTDTDEEPELNAGSHQMPRRAAAERTYTTSDRRDVLPEIGSNDSALPTNPTAANAGAAHRVQSVDPDDDGGLDEDSWQTAEPVPEQKVSPPGPLDDDRLLADQNSMSEDSRDSGVDFDNQSSDSRFESGSADGGSDDSSSASSGKQPFPSTARDEFTAGVASSVDPELTRAASQDDFGDLMESTATQFEPRPDTSGLRRGTADRSSPEQTFPSDGRHGFMDVGPAESVVPHPMVADEPFGVHAPMSDPAEFNLADFAYENKVVVASAESEPCELCEVQPGDSYWKISRRSYGTTRYFSALALYNQTRIRNPKKLRPGMKVLVPDAEFLEQKYPHLFQEANAREHRSGGYFVQPDGTAAYRIDERDTLSQIARKHLGRSSRWIQIYRLNRHVLSNPNRLKPGTVISLPDDATDVHMVP